MLYTAHHAEMYRQWLDGKAVDKPHAWAEFVSQRASGVSILDYGCSRRRLRHSLPASFWTRLAEYDPGVAGCEDSPMPADFVVCTDVLEHVEPACLEAVLDDLKRVTLHTLLLSVSTKPSDMTLPDGTPQHKIVELAEWWQEKLKRLDMTLTPLPCKARELAWLGRPNARP